MAKRPNSGALTKSFGAVDTWIFDLDNTLYPSRSDLFSQVDKRITDYISKALSLDRDEAHRIQKDYYRRYGTSLRGLMAEHDLDPHPFLDYVHDIDHSPLDPDPALGAVLAALPGRKYVFTNGSRGHAVNVTKRLGIEEQFEDMFGIVEADFTPKPAALPYNNLIERYGIAPDRSAMFEDIARNLEVPKALGMRTILVADEPENGTDMSWRGDWEQPDKTAPYVDHITTDVSGFLLGICDILKIDMTRADLPHLNGA